MGVVKLVSVTECDECGCQMHHVMDRGADIPDGWDLDELAQDAVRGGDPERINGRLVDYSAGATSVQDGKILCPSCTRDFDMASGEF